jgi:hypothetical protein
MKKLIYLICIAVLFFTGIQFAAAQEFNDLTSHTNRETAGLFGNDADLFFDVNDWKGLEFSKWFTFINLDDITFTAGPLPTWNAGLALNFERAYLGFYYYGKFSEGSQPHRKVTVHGPGGVTVTGVDAINLTTFTPTNGGISHNNNFGVLLGLGDHGLKFTLNHNVRTADIPIVTTIGGPMTVGTTTIPIDTNFYYRSRFGTITPKFQWGYAKDMEIGRFTTRPSASLELQIGFDEREYGGFTDLFGNPRDIENIEDFTQVNQFITPTIGFDSGAINFLSGDWGSIGIGFREEFGLRINGEGNDSTVPWRNKFTPYAVFDYSASEFLRFGAFLSVPIYGGWNGTSGNYFAIGAYAPIGTTLSSSLVEAGNLDRPKLDLGLQYRCAFFDSLSGKTTLLSRLVLNFGVQVFLPAYYNYGTFTEVGNTITEDKNNGWHRTNNVQRYSFGFSIFLTDNVVLDAETNATTMFKNWGLTETIGIQRLMLTIKH